MSALSLPGYRVLGSGRSAPETGLRNDVAAFIGPARRGPLGTPVRVTSPQELAAVFGAPEEAMSRAVAAYFANEGEVAWVLRTGSGGAAAKATRALDGAPRLALPGERLKVTASSPGAWADGIAVTIGYRAFGPLGAPELDVRVTAPGAPAYERAGLTVDELVGALEATGRLKAAFTGPPAPAGTGGPGMRRWELVLGGGTDPSVKADAYMDAIVEQAQVDEIALVCTPGIERLIGADEAAGVLAALAASAAASQDRLVVVAVEAADAEALRRWHQRVGRALPDPAHRRNVAVYTPWLLAEDLAHTSIDPYLPTDPTGHVCGVASRLDRERGSGWSPANELVDDAIDVAASAGAADYAFAYAHELNLLRRRIGGGLEIWGARTLDSGDGRYIAHRRLVHRLVRAIRRVAEPLVFDTNGPVLWFAVVRAVSGVLLEAFRTGALQGETPAQAYRVRCDETTNPPEAIDDGLVVCEIEVAPAVPMEFITLQLTIGAQGLLEVVEQ